MTGVASGIGKAVAQACIARGDTVFGIDRTDADCDADLSTKDGRSAAIRAAATWADGQIDGVVACAGLSVGHVGAIIGVNFFGAVEIVAGLNPLLRASPSARVVVVSSESMILGCDPETIEACLAGDEAAAVKAAMAAPDMVYRSSKRALSLWVRREAVTPEWAGSGILLNAIAPGVVVTQMTRQMLDTKDGTDRLNASTPMRIGRPGQPSEIAALAAFMTAPENSFMVGQTVFCDGGAEATLRPEHF